MTKSKSLGVVVGRFQLDAPHAGHIALLDHVADRHEVLVVFVGYNDVRHTPHNPLPPELRIAMIRAAYPEAFVTKLPDSKVGPQHWSEMLDKYIEQINPHVGAKLYGSRDNFFEKYSGKFETELVEQFEYHSATDIRAMIANQKNFDNDPAFRRGWIAAIHNQFAVTDPVVDIAIVSPDFSSVLLGRRGKGSPLRFPGGFVDRNDRSYEAAALRELSEEVTGITTGEPEYVFSTEVESSRYGSSGYGMKTILFCVTYESGTAQAGDDLDSVEWRDLNTALVDEIDSSHIPLLHELLRYREKRLQQVRAHAVA